MRRSVLRKLVSYQRKGYMLEFARRVGMAGKPGKLFFAHLSCQVCLNCYIRTGSYIVLILLYAPTPCAHDAPIFCEAREFIGFAAY